MTEKRYVRILDHLEKEVRIFDEHNQKNIFNIFFMELDSAICLKGALEDTVDLLNYFYEEKKNLKEENEQLKKEIVKFKKWEKHIRDVKREDLDKVFKMSIYEIAEAFKYYQERIKELEE